MRMRRRHNSGMQLLAVLFTYSMSFSHSLLLYDLYKLAGSALLCSSVDSMHIMYVGCYVMEDILIAYMQQGTCLYNYVIVNAPLQGLYGTRCKCIIPYSPCRHALTGLQPQCCNSSTRVLSDFDHQTSCCSQQPAVPQGNIYIYIIYIYILP